MAMKQMQVDVIHTAKAYIGELKNNGIRLTKYF